MQMGKLLPACFSSSGGETRSRTYARLRVQKNTQPRGCEKKQQRLCDRKEYYGMSCVCVFTDSIVGVRQRPTSICSTLIKMNYRMTLSHSAARISSSSKTWRKWWEELVCRDQESFQVFGRRKWMENVESDAAYQTPLQWFWAISHGGDDHFIRGIFHSGGCVSSHATHQLQGLSESDDCICSSLVGPVTRHHFTNQQAAQS